VSRSDEHIKYLRRDPQQSGDVAAPVRTTTVAAAAAAADDDDDDEAVV